MTADAAADVEMAIERDRDTQAWARWLARGLDAVLLWPATFLAFMAWGVAVELGRLPPESLQWLDEPLLAAAIQIAATFLFFCLWEPLFLSNTGTTPGKWIMGIRICRADGGRLSFGTALFRFLWVWTVGLGFGVPVVSLITMLLARSKLENEGATAWDQELDARVVHAKRHPTVWMLVIVLVIGVNLALSILDRVIAN